MKKSAKIPTNQIHLRRIIGQLKGVENMLQDKRSCGEIITQLMAVRASLETLGINVLRNESRECLSGTGSVKKKSQDLEKITSDLFKLT
ncbi:metal-sensitive transcriptional regulator [Patescibacteria group bacterium]|nr:metal-sensitive transcriptional regulator [Patescibacteria group bacterium]MBU1074969.1 metal-sensitive transcriptional regulator [Patescibacteria group bacterium]MBU1951726.1 metal-sensitive transcriptional regulator [Patescibacteria group bacterium]MBU2235562.1 metal-sensitive transcriptional regulator [Patescibacteria group bacterium]